MKSSHVRQNYLKALWIYVIALLLLGLTFHSEADVQATQRVAVSR
ncbi:MAG: hypothetical protein ACXWC9_02140 [Pseudobdellovibrionaceae bacterium]